MRFSKNSLSILFEDKYFIIVKKPAGIVVQGAPKGKPSLWSITREYIKERDSRPSLPFLGVVHRLDKPVSGAVVFAKRSKAASKLFKVFTSHQVIKVYVAKVKGVLRGEGLWRDYFKWDERQKKAKLYSTFKKDTKEALTYYEVIDKGLVLLSPITGRKHQLRAALSKRGCPVIGDVKYGGPPLSYPKAAILLHEIYLSFYHPYLEEEIEVFAEVPKYFSVKHLDKRLILEFSYKVLKARESLI